MKKNFLILSLFGILIGILVGFLYFQINYPFEKNCQIQKMFLVGKGQSVKEIAKNLEKENLIKNDFYFIFYLGIKGELKKLQAGIYNFAPAMSIKEIARKIVIGDVIKIKVTIPEGFTLDQTQERLTNTFMFNSTRTVLVLLKAGEYKKEFQFLEDAPTNATLEGYLFPDTYQIIYGTSMEEVVKIMLGNFDKKLTPDLRNEISRQKKTPKQSLVSARDATGRAIFEIITMASMIEKEVKTKEDKELVSGILWKRLGQGIPLQIDATISYVTGKQTTSPAGVASRPYGVKISKEETQIDSPYNTYKYRGLPIGPISNPGLESILAAIYPKDSDFWYYLSTPDGKTIFTKTLEEHNRAKAKYLK